MVLCCSMRHGNANQQLLARVALFSGQPHSISDPTIVAFVGLLLTGPIFRRVVSVLPSFLTCVLRAVRVERFWGCYSDADFGSAGLNNKRYNAAYGEQFLRNPKPQL